jgi:hypothetical protein
MLGYKKQAEKKPVAPTLLSQVQSLQSLLLTNIYTTWPIPGFNKCNFVTDDEIKQTGFLAHPTPSALAIVFQNDIRI